MDKCVMCGFEDLRVERRDYDYQALPGVKLLNLEVVVCPNCGEEYVAIPALDGLHRELTRFLLGKSARLNGPEFRFLRKELGWSGRDTARRMGVTPETVSRWENGHEPVSLMADHLIRMLVTVEAPISDYRAVDLETIDADSDAPATAKLEHEEEWRLAA